MDWSECFLESLCISYLRILTIEGGYLPVLVVVSARVTQPSSLFVWQKEAMGWWREGRGISGKVHVIIMSLCYAMLSACVSGLDMVCRLWFGDKWCFTKSMGISSLCPAICSASLKAKHHDWCWGLSQRGELVEIATFPLTQIKINFTINVAFEEVDSQFHWGRETEKNLKNILAASSCWSPFSPEGQCGIDQCFSSSGMGTRSGT